MIFRFAPRKLIPLIGIVFLVFAVPAFAEDEDLGVWDPIEPVNRGIFWFNDKVDRYLLEPVAKGYEKVTPDPIQKGVRNFFRNLRGPIDAVNALLQLKVSDAAEQTGRFLLNTTVGVGGVLDVAQEFGLERRRQDLGLTFASWGIPEGPYLVIPFIGPSNLRDGVGMLGDQFFDPTYYISYTDLSDNAQLAWILGLKALDVVDTRASLIDAIDAARESSLDEYLFMQSAYYQIRRGQARGEQIEGLPKAKPKNKTPTSQGADHDDDINFDDQG